MTTVLLFALVLMDLALIGAIFMLNRRQDEQGDAVAELTEERQLITEMRQAVREDLEQTQSKMREAIDRVGHLAAEAEQEVKSGSELLGKELEALITQLSTRFETPLKELATRQRYLDTVYKRIEREKIVIQKIIGRGEKIAKFFDQSVPYQEVLNEIEDKKYVDARSMIAQGITPFKIARELGMSEQEVKLLADIP